MGFKIDKGVPIPNLGGRPRKYPWEEMEVGDSFFCEEVVSSAAAYRNKRKPGKHFTVRKEGKGWRVWRDR